MPVLKPIRGIRLNKSHPLAHGLVGYWLLNEGSGNKVFDLSGNGNNGTRPGTGTVWAPGKFGSAQQLNGTDDSIGLTSHISFFNSLNDGTLIAWIYKNDNSNNPVIAMTDSASTDSIAWFIVRTDDAVEVYFKDSNGDVILRGQTNATLSDNRWYQIAYSSDASGNRFYINGVQQAVTYSTGSNATHAFYNHITGFDKFNIGMWDYLGTDRFFTGIIDIPIIYNRALSASEIALLYREPFCMFDRAWRPGLIGGQIVELSGTATALSSVEGSLSVNGLIVELAGTIVGRSNVNGYLSLLDWTERSWLTEALFNGMTANAFKLGTSLSLGWFWVRVTGCSALYRGAGMGEIDFANILAVSEQDAREVSPPSYISHNNGSTYFYVVRRFNNCGYQEHTLAAAVKVSIGSSGELAEPQPNNISSSKAEQVDSNKVRLVWFYCPLEQGSRPVSFNVYYDDRTGQIDFENPLATISYKGRRFYSFQSPALEAGEDGGGYLFAIRAEDAGGIENISLARLKIQLDTLNPDAIDILRAEAV